ncbi:UNVERIFIED_CONTAM: hypothetical protein HDU68_000471 [Siphonaria sp. JEL0065]|nr:hypothetical protein HDU68_000471 [Siphonaria sp. JEL0065]
MGSMERYRLKMLPMEGGHLSFPILVLSREVSHFLEGSPIPIGEAQIIKMPTPIIRASIGSVSQVESVVVDDDADLEDAVDGKLETEDFENGYLTKVDYDEREYEGEYEEDDGDEKEYEGDHEVDGKFEFEEEEGNYGGDGDVEFVHNALVAQEVDGFVEEEDGPDSDDVV